MPDKDDPLVAIRTRAYQLAETGKYEAWASLSAALVEEGLPEAAVQRLTSDTFFQIMLKDRMTAAARGG